MKLSAPTKKPPPENTLSLINIVFLMLIFFLVAGHISTQPKGDIQLTEIKTVKSTKPPSDAIGITARGDIIFRGKQVTKDQLLHMLRATRDKDIQSFRVMPDRELSAAQLVDVLEIIGQAGYRRAKIISLRKRPG